MTSLEKRYFPWEYKTVSYMGYELDRVFVNDKELALLHACYLIVDDKTTIRDAALKCNFAKSTLHWQIHHKLRFLSPELYRSVKNQLKENMKKKRRKFIKNKEELTCLVVY